MDYLFRNKTNSTKVKKLKVLFLCTGNSARSIMGEYILKMRSPGRFESFSAGASPKDAPHPMAVKVLKEQFNIDASDARSKSWDEFKGEQFDIVITVCDNARETCPTWPEHPIVAHWGSPDPASFSGSDEETRKHFSEVALEITRRIDLLVSLPQESLQTFSSDSERAVRKIGES